MHQPVLVVSRQLPDAFMAGLAQLGELRVATDQAEGVFEGASVYISPGVDPVPADLIDRFPPSLKLIANIAVGTDNIDLEAAARRGIMVSNTPVVTEDTADLTLALMLATCRRLNVTEQALRAGQWQRAQSILGCRVHGATLGIIGFGAIGQAVARRAMGFGMTVLYHGPNRKTAAEQELGTRYMADLDDLLESADIISLNCALTPTTRHLLDARALARVKPGAVVINTGRGPLIHEAALVEALESGHLGGAGLDVFEFEPEVTPRLLAFDNVTLLPHIGSATVTCRTDMALRTLDNIQAFLADGQPIDAVT